MPGSAPPTRAPAWFRRLAGARAEERTYRALAFGFLPAAVLFGVLAAPAAAGQAGDWPAWWDVLAWVVGIGPSLLLGASAFAVPLSVLRRIARVAVVGVLTTLASVPVVAPQGPDLDGQSWFLALCGLGLIAAALAVRPLGAVTIEVAGAILCGAARLATDRSDALVEGLQDGLYVLLFTLTFVALGASALAAGRAADAEEARAVATEAAAAADVARDRERARINALVHDRVLATLLSAARQVPGSGPFAQADARRALDGLEALLADAPASPGPVDGQDLVWQAQAVTTELAPEAVFGFEVTSARSLSSDVVEALLAASAEALRNSLRHAGDGNRTVHVRVDEDGARIDVLDDGVGFDPAGVPVGRLGIAESIEGRMRAVPGGSAHVVSQPGVGTRVLLRWTG